MTSIAQIAKDVRRRSRAKAPPERELPHHIAVAEVLRRFARHDVLWLHPANGELRHKRVAAKLKAMGVQAGASDFILGFDGRGYVLEIKRPGGAKPSAEQAEFMDLAIRAGWETAVAYGIEPAIEILNRWGALRVRVTPAMIGRAAA